MGMDEFVVVDGDGWNRWDSNYRMDGIVKKGWM